MKSEYARLREEQERVERRKPWLAFSRAEPVQHKPAEPDHFVWRDVGELFRGSAEGVAAGQLREAK